jgi:hypothetical protein
MLKIDNSLLQEVGLGTLPDTEKNSFLRHVYETLEMRVGIRLADQMSNEQLDEFERYFEAKDDAGAFKWLETNFPNYKEIVQQEFDKLKAEVAQSAPQILVASQAQAAQVPGQTQSQSPPAVEPTGTPDTSPVPPPPPMPAAPAIPQPASPMASPAPSAVPLPADPASPSPQPFADPTPTFSPPPPSQPAAPPPVEPPFPVEQPPAGPGQP